MSSERQTTSRITVIRRDAFFLEEWPMIKLPGPKPYPTNNYKERKKLTTRGCFR